MENEQREADGLSREGDGYYGDPSSAMWSVYLSMTDPQDAALVDRWKGDCDGILIFTGLFSATVAAFAVESYKSLQLDPQDVSAALLAQISSQLSALANNGTTIPSTDPLPPFRPSGPMRRVNILWFLSLVVSISCALAAVMIQQWSRRYLSLTRRETDRDTTPRRRARTRTFFHSGVERYGLSRASDVIPALLHGSVLLFFAGLVQFAFVVDRVFAWFVLGGVSAVCGAYAVLTFMPVLALNAPYSTPLSPVVWTVSQSTYAILLAVVYVPSNIIAPLSSFTHRAMDALLRARDRLEHGFQGTGTSSNGNGSIDVGPEYDAQAILWLARHLPDDDGDAGLVRFVGTIPGYLHDAWRDPWTSSALFGAVRNTDIGARIGRLLFSSVAGASAGSIAPAYVSIYDAGAGAHNDDPARVRRALVCLEALWHLSVACEAHGLPLHTLDPKRHGVGATKLLRDDPSPAVRVAAWCASVARVAAWCASVARVPALVRSMRTMTATIHAGERQVALSFVPSFVVKACDVYGGDVVRDGTAVAVSVLVHAVLPDLHALSKLRRAAVADTVRFLGRAMMAGGANASAGAREVVVGAGEAVSAKREWGTARGQKGEVYEGLERALEGLVRSFGVVDARLGETRSQRPEVG